LQKLWFHDSIDKRKTILFSSHQVETTYSMRKSVNLEGLHVVEQRGIL